MTVNPYILNPCCNDQMFMTESNLPAAEINKRNGGDNMGWAHYPNVHEQIKIVWTRHKLFICTTLY